MDTNKNRHKCDELARNHLWETFDYQDNLKMVSYVKLGMRINHPTQGKTQLFRKRVSFDLLDKIFKNPRIHTNQGYTQTF